MADTHPVDPTRRRLLSPAATTSMVHVVSFVLRGFPEKLDDIRRSISVRPHFDVVAAEGSRLVLVSELASEGDLVSTLEELQSIPGVLNAALVYHHAEPGHALDEEVPDVHAP